MFDRIKFTPRKGAIHIALDLFFEGDYIVFREVGNEILVLERNLKGFEEREEISIYDTAKQIRYVVAPAEIGFTVTVEEMSLDTLLKLGLSRDALDQMILMKKRVINPRV